MDCGPTCLRMVAKYYGKNYSLQKIREKSFISREGVSLLNLSVAAELIGFRTLAAKIPISKIVEVPKPFIAHWNKKHFVVVFEIKRDKIHVADPAHGILRLNRNQFSKGWINDKVNGEEVGTILFLEPTPEFYQTVDNTDNTKGFSFLFKYLIPYKKFIYQLFIGMLAGSTLQLIFPFLAQSIVDIGINTKDINFITLILLAQLMLFAGRMTVEFTRSWILLHLGSRLNISILSDFVMKLMKLPISFFDSKMIGDILQRISDHRRIELFLTSSSLNAFFSLFNLVIFGVVLAIYSSKVFLIFLLGSSAYFAWIILFLKKRREFDYIQFGQLSTNHTNLIQLINGMQEIKLQNCERKKRWEWERIQAGLFKMKSRSLALNQYQQAGSQFINELKNIFVSYLSAKAVVDGEITLGMMLAIQYIIGQLNSPINQLISFIHLAQDAKISFERLSEIHNKVDEDPVIESKISNVFISKSIHISNLNFKYEGSNSSFSLRNINLTIPEGKVTAIVGASGSGKTTLIKLLLRFYKPSDGKIRIGEIDFSSISNRFWREKCGAVLQDGYIFSDTIAQNIALSDETIDEDKLLHAVKTANIQSFIEGLPLSYNTQIGSDGHGLSQGQKQRVLIARAIYKSPEFIFFDEATNALDSTNEREIMNNLKDFFHGRTVVVVAHRLSTVRNADQIIVLGNGLITEIGSHEELVLRKGDYFTLIKNQLELGE